jgi:hypothetical protein
MHSDDSVQSDRLARLWAGQSTRERCTLCEFSWMAGPSPATTVEGNRLSATIHTKPMIPLAGLDPAIHVFLGLGDLGGQDVDTRNKSGQSVLTVASWLSLST